MPADLLAAIEKASPTFSKGQHRISQYICEHYDKAAFMTASKLGSTVGVSESTVVRFASELGFDGYPQLQKALQELFHQMGQDIRQMDRRLAKQVYRNKVENFADTYVVLTVVNGRRKFGTAFYFDVFKSGTNELLYAYMIMLDKDDPDDEKNYAMMVNKFYKNFDWAAEKQQKEQEKARREAERKAEREAEKAKK